MKKPSIVLIVVIIYFLAVFLCRPLVRSWTQPPLKNQFDRLAICQYTYFDKHDRMPGDLSHLPPELKSFVDDGKSGIMWDPEKNTLSYVFGHPYPINDSAITFLTFGLVVPSARTLGSSITPDSIRTNTPALSLHGVFAFGRIRRCSTSPTCSESFVLIDGWSQLEKCHDCVWLS